MITGGIMLAEPADADALDSDALSEDDDIFDAEALALVEALLLADADEPPESLDEPQAARATVAAPAVSARPSRVRWVLGMGILDSNGVRRHAAARAGVRSGGFPSDSTPMTAQGRQDGQPDTPTTAAHRNRRGREGVCSRKS
jgi:hypothetical protein